MGEIVGVSEAVGDEVPDSVALADAAGAAAVAEFEIDGLSVLVGDAVLERAPEVDAEFDGDIVPLAVGDAVCEGDRELVLVTVEEAEGVLVAEEDALTQTPYTDGGSTRMRPYMLSAAYNKPDGSSIARP